MEIEGYETKTLNLAAFLYTCGMHLEKTTRVNGQVFFLFTPKDQAEELVEYYFSDKAVVNPRELFARLNDLKDLIFAGGRNE